MSTSASTRSSSPGRTGRGHFNSSALEPMIPPAGRKPLSTRSRMVSAAVCHPLAARLPKKEPRAAPSSRWNGCGSNWAAKALIAAASTRSVPETYFCPGAKSSSQITTAAPARGSRSRRFHAAPARSNDAKPTRLEGLQGSPVFLVVRVADGGAQLGVELAAIEGHLLRLHRNHCAGGHDEVAGVLDVEGELSAVRRDGADGAEFLRPVVD